MLLKILDGTAFRATDLCRAPSGAYRKHLMYLMLDFEHNWIVATNGHRLIRMKNAFGDDFKRDPATMPSTMLIRPERRIPFTWKVVTLETLNDAWMMLTGYNNDKDLEIRGRMLAAIGTGMTYPDIERVIPSRGAPDNITVLKVGFNPQYLADIAKTTSSEMVALDLVDERKPIIVSFDKLQNVDCVLMPMAVKEDELTRLSDG